MISSCDEEEELIPAFQSMLASDQLHLSGKIYGLWVDEMKSWFNERLNQD
ncbi:MAG: hypothetical protein OCD76_23995 [Reichenbachiella sp.]